MSLFSYIICLIFILLGGLLFDRAEFGTAIAMWMVASLISTDALISAIKKEKP